MSALERIAELHGDPVTMSGSGQVCCPACGDEWPCPTRRLCDEYRRERIDGMKRQDFDELADERDAARADADRLAEAAETFLRMEYRRGGIPYEGARASLRAALAAHDATRAKEGL